MKKNKIIGLFVAVAGVVASISVASALYTKGATQAHFGIGAEWHALGGTVTYKINDKSGTSGTISPSYLTAEGTNGGEGFGGLYTQAHYSIPLGASYSNDVPAQNFVVGNFEINLTNIHSKFQNNAKIWAEVKGYNESSIGKSTYNKIFMTQDVALTTSSYTVAKDIAVSCSGTQSVEIYIKLNAALSETEIFELTEQKAFNLSVTWGAPSSDFEFAYVVGNGTMWKEDDVYAMMPNINASSWEWIYNNLPGTMDKAKCKKGEGWSSGDDAVLDKTKTYQVIWDGNNANAAVFTVETA